MDATHGAWPLSDEPSWRESVVAPRPSHVAPRDPWTLEDVLRAVSELDAELDAALPAQRVEAFFQVMVQLFPQRRVVVRMFEHGRVGDTHASHPLTEPNAALVLSEQGVARAREFRAALPTIEALASAGCGLVVPPFRIEPRAPVVTVGASHAVDSLVVVEGAPIGVVAVESDAPVDALAPVLAMLADRLGQTLARVQRAQRESFLRGYVAELFEHASGPVVAFGPDGALCAANEKALALVEKPRSALLGLGFAELVSQEKAARLEEVFRTVLDGGSVSEVALTLRREDGAEVETRWSVTPIPDGSGRPGAVLAIGVDRSAVSRLERQVAHAERLATLGQLAAGVLHELNNPLTSIGVYSDYLHQKARRSGAEAGDVEKLKRIHEATQRMTRFTRELVSYARPSSGEPIDHVLSLTLEHAVSLCEHLLDESGVLVERDFRDQGTLVRAVPGQLHQVFVNLITNACQAMVEAGDPARPPLLRLRTWAEESEVCAEISDTGPGIPAGNVGKVFEPFFTTKREGSGTGLGLSIVKNLVEQNGGSICVRTRHGIVPAGTTFEIRLRRA